MSKQPKPNQMKEFKSYLDLITELGICDRCKEGGKKKKHLHVLQNLGPHVDG